MDIHLFGNAYVVEYTTSDGKRQFTSFMTMPTKRDMETLDYGRGKPRLIKTPKGKRASGFTREEY